MAATDPLVVVPYDFSPPSKAALDRAVGLARPLGARLQIVHVIDDSAYYLVPFGVPPLVPPALRELEGRLGAHLASVVGPLRQAGVGCETTLLCGRPAPTLLDYAEEAGPFMIVMGTHGRTGWRHTLLGSVAERVARRARCPVLVVPDPERA
jgi:nucleotide-binding universal stress UspA family protein